MSIDESSTKKCNACGVIKSLTDYYYHKLRGRSIPYSECKACTIKRNVKYKKEHPQSKEKIKQVHDAYYSKNREAILAKRKLKYPENKDKAAKISPRIICMVY